MIDFIVDHIRSYALSILHHGAAAVVAAAAAPRATAAAPAAGSPAAGAAATQGLPMKQPKATKKIPNTMPV